MFSGGIKETCRMQWVNENRKLGFNPVYIFLIFHKLQPNKKTPLYTSIKFSWQNNEINK